MATFVKILLWNILNLLSYSDLNMVKKRYSLETQNKFIKHICSFLLNYLTILKNPKIFRIIITIFF